MRNATSHPHHRADASIDFASGTNALLAVWLFLSPWLLGYSTRAVLWNNLVVGAVVFVLATIRIASQTRAGLPGWINAILGLWLVAAPFMFAGARSVQRWNCVVVGFVVALLAFTSGTAGATRER